MIKPKIFLSALINSVLWIPILLLFFPPVLLLWIYRNLLEVVAIKILKKDFRLPNKSTDILMCQGDSFKAAPNTNCAQVWLVAGNWITASEFSSHFHQCFLKENSDKYKNLYAHLVKFGGYMFYSHCKPNQLDLTWHIREYSISAFGSNGTLESFAAYWMTTNTYEEGRPAWQIAIVHLGGPDQNTVETGIVAKFSHALVDGYSFIHIVGKLTGNPAPYIVESKTYSWLDKLKYVFQAPKDLFTMYIDIGLCQESRSPFQKPDCTRNTASLKKQQWNMSFSTLDLAALKALRKATNTHFASLMISAQVGALRRLLLETKSETDLPDYLWTASALPWPNHPHILTNHYAVGYFKCPLKLANSLERLDFVESSYRRYTEMEAKEKGFFVVLPFARAIPACLGRFIVHYDFAMLNVSLYFASLLLSSKKHYLLGREVKKLYMPLACPDTVPVGLNGITTSHSDQVDLSITACTTVVRNQEELDRLTQVYFKQELDAIAFQCDLTSMVGDEKIEKIKC